MGKCIFVVIFDAISFNKISISDEISKKFSYIKSSNDFIEWLIELDINDINVVLWIKNKNEFI